MMGRRWRLFGSTAPLALYSAFFTGGLLLATVTPVQAVPCTGAVDTANGTTCTGGSTTADLVTYPNGNDDYENGDFTLRLDNHDVTGNILFGAAPAGDIFDGNGIIILENGSDVSNTDVNNVSGVGIIASVDSTGENLTVDVRSTSSVTGGSDGIRANTENGDVLIKTEAGTTITGISGDGIQVSTEGDIDDIGDVFVTAAGNVIGGDDGISAQSITGSINVFTDTTSRVEGGGDGIDAQTSGNVFVTAGGNVSGGIDGIFAQSETGTVNVTTSENAQIKGGNDGISAQTTAGGSVTIITGKNSLIVGGADIGIEAGSIAGGAITVITGENSRVEGATEGIQALSVVDGSVIVNTGAFSVVSGGSGDGIDATSFAGGAITVTTGANSNALGGSDGSGIQAGTTGSATVAIVNNGEAAGSVAGISASSETGAIHITNSLKGEIRNQAFDRDGVAIRTTGGAASINNEGLISGRIETGANADVLNNDGIWATNGTSEFGAGVDTVNNRFRIAAADNGGITETTIFAGLDALNNSATISLTDQTAGDGSNVSDQLQIAGNYAGQGNATLGVDASLGGAGSLSDVLFVGGNTSGVTRIVVNNTSLGPGSLNTDGILVVDVRGIAEADDFVLANGPIDTGFFVYDLIFNNTDQANDQFLLVSEADSDVFETLATVASSQAIWRETADAWEARQQAVRDRINAGIMVTAVADPALPGSVAPENGLWFSALGSWTARDSQISGFDLDYDQSIYGFVAGADLGADLGDDATLLFGVLAGYVDSTLNFDASATSIKTDGATLGVYASLLDGGFFANVLLQADLLNLNYSAPSLPADNSNDAGVTSFGARADMGYRFDTGNLFIEPMVSLDAISTTIDDFSVGGADIDAGTNESFRAGAGLRAGVAAESVRASAIGRIWNVFATDNEVAFTPDGPVLALSDDTLEGVYGEVSGQVDVDLTSGTLLFAKGGVLFSDDITKPSVTGGFNFTW